MAEPKKSPPWNQIHRSLDRALACCGLSPVEQIIVEHAREMCYAVALRKGFKDPVPFRPEHHRLARRLKLTRPAITRAYHRLLASKVLIPIDERGVIVNKHFATWIEPHRLSEALLTYAIQGATWKPGEDPLVGNQSSTSAVTDRAPVGNQSSTSAVTNRAPAPCSKASGRASARFPEREERVFLREESVRGETNKKNGSRRSGPEGTRTGTPEPEPFSDEWKALRPHIFPPKE